MIQKNDLENTQTILPYLSMNSLNLNFMLDLYLRNGEAITRIMAALWEQGALSPLHCFAK